MSKYTIYFIFYLFLESVKCMKFLFDPIPLPQNIVAQTNHQ